MCSSDLGHQASFQSPLTPRPEKADWLGEGILKYFGWAKDYVGLHFDSYDTNIYNPIIKEQVIQANPTNKGHITVYLPHYGLNTLQEHFSKLSDIPFQIFSPLVKNPYREKNCAFIPVNNEAFTESMITSEGVITGAGFETPAETLYLGKKLMAIPIRGQYEQLCNAAALEKLNVTVINKIESDFTNKIVEWLNQSKFTTISLQHSTQQLIQLVVTKGIAAKGNIIESIHTPTNPLSGAALFQ